MPKLLVCCEESQRVCMAFRERGWEAYSCDIEPEDERVVRGDFLQLSLPYKQGRCIIGNPPYGSKGNLFTQFYNKACELMLGEDTDDEA